jgi:hypothetical protein
MAASQCAPGQFFVSFLNTPDQAAVSWATNCSASTQVKWGTTANTLNNLVAGNQSQYAFGDGSYTSPYLHHTILTGLPNASRIFYTVGGDASGFSGIMSFTSSPGAGLVRGGARFAVIGDLGQTSNSEDTVNHIASSPNNFTAMIHAGDLSYADDDEPRWDSWQEMVAPLASGLPWMTVVGNHEVELDINLKTFEAYTARFLMPAINYGTPSQSRQLFYSFRAAGVHWLMLSSYSDYSATSPQYAWLQAEVGRIDRSVTPWVVAVLHAPWYNSNYAHQGEGDAMKAAMETLLYNAGVDLVYAGHVHAYERSYRTYQGLANPAGPYYITIGDGGNREGLADTWMSPQPSWSAFRQASYGHGELQVVNATHMLWEWHQNPDLEPEVADSLWIVKAQSTGREATAPRQEAGARFRKHGKKVAPALPNPQGVTSRPRFAKHAGDALTQAAPAAE